MRLSTTPTPTELTAWVHRGVALFCLGALVPAGFMATDQLQHLAPWWLVIFGLGIVGLTAAMTALSIARRSLVGAARAYLLLVAAGVVTWPWGWESSEAASGSPWLWMCLGVASIWAALVIGTKWGFIYAIVVGAAFAGVRLTPSGQGIALVAAMQDMLVLVINPSAVIIGISLLTDAIAQLNSTAVAFQQQRARAAVEEALVEERRRLDSIVHDEVMTTLVNAAMVGPNRDTRVTALAQHAINQLDLAGETGEDRVPVTVEHLGWLVKDVVTSLVPDAEVALDVSEPELLVPPSVASAVGQACREVAMNIARHAEAHHVTVLIGDADAPGVRVVVSDDGTGFDPGQVPGDRFGLQYSVLERMQSVGGAADVRSQPGHGTVVELTWLVPPEPASPARRPRFRFRLPRLRGGHYPVLPNLEPGTLAGLISLLVGLHFVLGWTTLDQVDAVWPVFVAQGLAVAATWLALRRLARNPLPRASGVAVLVLLSATTLLVQSVLPMGRWPGYATWYSSVVMVLLIVLLFRGRQVLAWIGLAAFVAESLFWAFTHGLGFGEVVRVSFGPVSWMIVAQLVGGWLIDIGNRVHEVREGSYAANQAIAESYSKLVLRDLWLRQLRGQVGPLLEKLADPQAALTAADLEACVSLERRLRDGLRAANLLSDGTQDIVEAARSRGVDVTLVDSRGSALPEVVQKALRQSLTGLLNDRSVTRVVARAAPEGYDDVVTILTVRANGRTQLVGLDENGTHNAR